VTDANGLRAALRDTTTLLLDFDGPVCDIFANLPATDVAAGLISTLTAHHIDLRPDVSSEPDPLEVLRWTAKCRDHEALRIAENYLRDAEFKAASSAVETPGAAPVMHAARDAGLKIAIVSNNSEPAIVAFLEAHGMLECVSAIIGRVPYDPTKMKPNPAPILAALRVVGSAPEATTLVGDSVADVIAAASANVRLIGYANKPHKRGRLMSAGASVVVDDMSSIALALSD
jgi:phosphoglycolate phosphatase-like HAD superfamily hydrolase